ncbi:MAG TPA: hypothetical protein VJ346_03335 [Bacteroidales bacterium]|nr:hypothetical protein [Bacteroidales bacterium]
MFEFKNLLTFLIIIILFVIEGLSEVTILSVPGAFIRWIFEGRKENFKKFYKEKAILNTILGVVALAILLLIIVLLIKVFAQ